MSEAKKIDELTKEQAEKAMLAKIERKEMIRDFIKLVRLMHDHTLEEYKTIERGPLEQRGRIFETIPHHMETITECLKNYEKELTDNIHTLKAIHAWGKEVDDEKASKAKVGELQTAEA
jgi:hypothetical protein